jgi:hypothetical protein
VSKKRGYDYTASNDDQPSTSAESSNTTVELESTRRLSSRTKKAIKYSELDEEVANSSSLSKTSGNNAEAAPAKTSNSKKANGADKRLAAVTNKTKNPKSTIISTKKTPNGDLVNGRAKVKPIHSGQYK